MNRDDTHLILVVDDERSELLDAPPVPHLSLSGPHSLGLVDASDVSVGAVAAKELDGLTGLGQGLDLVGDHEGNLGNLLDGMT